MSITSGEQKFQEMMLPQVWKSNCLASTKSNINLVNNLLQERVPEKWFKLGKVELDSNGDYEKAKYYFNKELFYNSSHWQSHYLLSYLYIASSEDNINLNLSCSHFIAAIDFTVHKTFRELWRFDSRYPEYLDFLYSFYKEEIENKVFKEKDIDEVLKVKGNDELLLALLMVCHFNYSNSPDLLYYIEAYNRSRLNRNGLLCLLEGMHKSSWSKYALEAPEILGITVQQRPNCAMSYMSRAMAYKFLIRVTRNKGESPINFELDTEAIYAIRLSIIEDFSRAFELDPEATWVKQDIGYQRILIGDFMNALNDFTFLIERDSNDPQSCGFMNRAMVKIKMKDFEGAVEDLTTCITLDNSNDLYQAYYLRAEVKMLQSKIKEAINDYTQIIQLNSDCTMAFFKRAIAYEMIGNNSSFNSDMAEYEKLKNIESVSEWKSNSYQWTNLWGIEMMD